MDWYKNHLLNIIGTTEKSLYLTVTLETASPHEHMRIICDRESILSLCVSLFLCAAKSENGIYGERNESDWENDMNRIHGQILSHLFGDQPKR